jgi:hypothetical protein
MRRAGLSRRARTSASSAVTVSAFLAAIVTLHPRGEELRELSSIVWMALGASVILIAVGPRQMLDRAVSLAVAVCTNAMFWLMLHGPELWPGATGAWHPFFYFVTLPLLVACATCVMLLMTGLERLFLRRRSGHMALR